MEIERNCKCDYCGHVHTCFKCHKGVMCAHGTIGWPDMVSLVVRNAWEARFILVRYMCEEKEEKTCPSWMLAVHGSQIQIKIYSYQDQENFNFKTININMEQETNYV